MAYGWFMERRYNVNQQSKGLYSVYLYLCVFFSCAPCLFQLSCLPVNLQVNIQAEQTVKRFASHLLLPVLFSGILYLPLTLFSFSSLQLITFHFALLRSWPTQFDNVENNASTTQSIYICIYIYQQQPNQPPLREYLSLNSEQINEPLKSWKILDMRPILEGILVKQFLILISATPGSFSQSSQSCLHLFLSFHLFHSLSLSSFLSFSLSQSVCRL